MGILNIIQAAYGDCFLLEFGTIENPKYILIDGGPKSIYDFHLKKKIQTIKNKGGNLDLVILSHVDNDHIIGLLDLLSELQEQKTNNKPETVSIKALWHNTFDKTIGRDSEISNLFQTLIRSVKQSSQYLPATNNLIQGINEGNKLRIIATALKIPINQEFKNNLITLENSKKIHQFEDIKIHILGPTKENIDNLNKEWIEWLEKHKDNFISLDPNVTEMVDNSIPNLSSIMILVETQNKKILFMGDGRGDHLIQGMMKAKLINSEGKIHVDILKVPHHGSDRNVAKNFFQQITADKYIISANGRYGHPKLSTLIWIVEAAKEQNRKIEIIATNNTYSIRKLKKEYNPDDYGYKIKLINQGESLITINL